MLEYLSEHVDRGLLFFVVLFTTATATSLITRNRYDRDRGRVDYEDVQDDESQNR